MITEIGTFCTKMDLTLTLCKEEPTELETYDSVKSEKDDPLFINREKDVFSGINEFMERSSFKKEKIEDFTSKENVEKRFIKKEKVEDDTNFNQNEYSFQKEENCSEDLSTSSITEKVQHVYLMYESILNLNSLLKEYSRSNNN